jgi:hypothetical protein
MTQMLSKKITLTTLITESSMEKIGLFEFVILLGMIIATIMVIVYTFRKLGKTKLTGQQKIGWTLIIIFFHILGIIAFLLYHDYYLSPERRAN